MKSRMDGLDVWFMMKELKELAGSKLNKIFHTDDFFVFQFHLTGKGKKLLKITPGFIFLIETYHAPTLIKPFCKTLRKHLTNAFLRNIQQISTERVIQFDFETKEGKFILFAEFFDRGNVILCDKNKKIIIPFHSQLRKQRTTKRGEIYKLPSTKKSIFEAKIEDFKHTKSPISRILAVDFGLGKEYAEELCLRTGIDPDQKELAVMEINNLISAVEQLQTLKAKPAIIKDTPMPFKLKKYEKEKSEYFETFSKALEKTILPIKKITTHEKKKEKIMKIIKMQEDQITKLKKQSKENTAKGEAIYHNYAVIKEILDNINKLKKELSWHDIKERLKNHEHIKVILDKKQEVVVDI